MRSDRPSLFSGKLLSLWIGVMMTIKSSSSSTNRSRIMRSAWLPGGIRASNKCPESFYHTESRSDQRESKLLLLSAGERHLRHTVVCKRRCPTVVPDKASGMPSTLPLADRLSREKNRSPKVRFRRGLLKCLYFRHCHSKSLKISADWHFGKTCPFFQCNLRKLKFSFPSHGFLSRGLLFIC